MWQPSPPPKPPSEGAEYLLQIASYYRDLVEYYQNAAEQAQLRLSCVEALLAESTVTQATAIEERFSVANQERQSFSDQQEPLSIPADAEPSPPEPPPPASNQEAPESNEEAVSKSLREGAIADPETQTTPQESESLSLEEPSQELAAVESQPLEPEEKPIPSEDEGEKLLEANRSTSPKSRTKRGKKTSLPPSPKFQKHPSLPDALQNYLKQQYPSPCSVGEIFEWLYPDGVPKAKQEKTKKAINNALLNYRGRMGWERVGLGKYAWVSS